jgi:hypothetical protein
MLRVFLFLAFLTAFIYGCKKADEQPAIKWRIDPEALKYIKLNVGQYFIYKDSATGREDSVVVTKSETHMEPYAYSYYNLDNRWVTENVQREGFELELTLKTSNTSTKWLWGKVLVSRLAYDNLQFDDMIDNTGSMFFSPLSPPSCSCTGTLPSMTVEGKTYQSVVFQLNGDHWRDYYWAPNVGLIKRTRTDGGITYTATLLRHN